MNYKAEGTFPFEGDYVKHIKTGNVYKVLYDCKIKSPDTNKWHIGIVYKSITTDEVYSRALNSFLENFEDAEDSELI